jgi:hypothetical protein
VPLTDDQKAMLRLLAQREEGYDDMAALMGIGVEEVRERVKEALAEVDEEASRGRPSEEAAAVVPPPRPSPAAPEPPPPPAAPEPQASVRRQQRFRGLKLPRDRGALIGLGAGVLAVVVMAIVLAVSGGSSSSSVTSGEGGSSAEGANLTEALLSPLAGGEASGRALFGRYKKNVLLQVEAEGLEPAPAGEAYTVWLYRSPKLALQVGAVPVSKEGKIAAQLQIPAQLLAYVASGAFNQVDVALTSTAAYKAALAKAKAEQKLPPHLGESVLRGEITGPAIRTR